MKTDVTVYMNSGNSIHLNDVDRAMVTTFVNAWSRRVAGDMSYTVILNLQEEFYSTVPHSEARTHSFVVDQIEAISY